MKSGRKPALFGALFLFLLAVSAQALTVEVDLGWGYNSTWWSSGDAQTGLVNDFHLQQGSIVQVILYNSATASAPGSTATANFPDTRYGSYVGPGIDAEPVGVSGNNYPGTTTPTLTGDNNIYNPYKTPAGHVIGYETQIGSPVSGGGNGSNYWFRIVEQFTIYGTYDRLYIRVFGATDFPQGEVISSYWGLSPVQEFSSTLDTYYPVIDDTVANKTNYFEVIPEPGTMALLGLGAAGLLAGHRRRQKSPRGK